MQELIVVFSFSMVAVMLGVLAGAWMSEIFVFKPNRKRASLERDRLVQRLLDQTEVTGVSSSQEQEEGRKVGNNIDLWA